jgi:hypothetical protein
MAVDGAGAVAGELVFAEAEALDLRAHGAVEDQDPLARGGLQGLPRIGPADRIV